MAQRIYRVTAIVRAPLDTVVGSNALSSGIMGAFELNVGDTFELISHNVEPDPVRAESMDELTELIAEAIDDSMDMDWRSSDGARAIVNMLVREGYTVVQRGEDSDVAIAIGEHAFRAGYLEACDVTEYNVDKAWSNYTPPDELCGKALT